MLYIQFLSFWIANYRVSIWRDGIESSSTAIEKMEKMKEFMREQKREGRTRKLMEKNKINLEKKFVQK